jgi:hypothetical protein
MRLLLERLELNFGRITDDALKHLAGLTSLTYLRIGHTDRISGDGSRHLVNARGLRVLD